MLKAETNGTGGRGAERGVAERSAAPAGRAKEAAPDPELIEQARRRRFTAEYKLRILREAEACTRPGEIGALLRREGLYTSHLSEWRKQRDQGALEALGRRRGRRKPHPLEAENEKLRKRAERAETELERARKVIEVQGNVSALLGELLKPRGAKPDGSSDK
jgi:transposase-like protein